MIVEIQLFAVARQLAQKDSVSLDMSEPVTVGDLRRELAARVPALVPVLAHVRFAVDNEYADDQSVISADSRVACIPPVSGG